MRKQNIFFIEYRWFRGIFPCVWLAYAILLVKICDHRLPFISRWSHFDGRDILLSFTSQVVAIRIEVLRLPVELIPRNIYTAFSIIHSSFIGWGSFCRLLPHIAMKETFYNPLSSTRDYLFFLYNAWLSSVNIIYSLIDMSLRADHGRKILRRCLGDQKKQISMRYPRRGTQQPLASFIERTYSRKDH